MSRYLPGTDPATMTTAGLPAGSSLQSLLAQLIANRNGGTPIDRPAPSVNPGMAEDAVQQPRSRFDLQDLVDGTTPGGLTPMIGPGGYSPPGGSGNVTSTNSIPGYNPSYTDGGPGGRSALNYRQFLDNTMTPRRSGGYNFGGSGGMPMPYGYQPRQPRGFGGFGGFGGMMGMGLGGGFGMGYPQMGGYGYGFGQGMGGFSRPSYGGYGGFGSPYGGYGGFSNPMMGMGLGSYGMNQTQPMNQFQDMRSMTAQQQPAMPMQSAQQQANPYQQQYQQAFY